jgi:pimeloyl-ACP methyl ester carboxylesterase
LSFIATFVSSYLLIHGAWHGGWCWHKVLARLRAAGKSATAPDLPSLGRDRTPVAEITLQNWTDSVCGHLDEADEPVILVGHSRAGAVISQAAEQRPQKVRSLVYLAAYLLADRESVSQTALKDERSLVPSNMVLAPDRKSSSLREAVIKDALYGECPEEDVILAQSLLTPEAVAPLTTPIRISAANYGRVPRVYIECRRDRAVSLSEQRRMVSAMPCQQVISLDTDHSPFFSSPDALTAHLLSLQS